jgi:hypothetical protein
MNKQEVIMCPEKLFWYKDPQGALLGPVDISMLTRLLAEGHLSLDTELLLPDGCSIRLRDLPEFGGQSAKVPAKDIPAAVKWIGHAWGLLLVSLLLSMGPTGFIVLVCSPHPYGPGIERSVSYDSTQPLSNFDRVRFKHLRAAERWDKSLLWAGATLGLTAYIGSLICAVWALLAGGTRHKMVRILAMVLFVIAFCLLCYGISHRHESLVLY